MSDKFCYHSFNPEEHDGKTWMVCAKCGKQNPLGLFQTHDFERDGPVTTFRDNGGKLPAGLDYFHNLLSPPGPFMRLLKRKRQRTCKVWKPKTATRISRIEGTFDHTWRTNPWEWRCRACNYRGSQPTWKLAYHQATRHAHNHH